MYIISPSLGLGLRRSMFSNCPSHPDTGPPSTLWIGRQGTDSVSVASKACLIPEGGADFETGISGPPLPLHPALSKDVSLDDFYNLGEQMSQEKGRKCGHVWQGI